MRRDMLTEFNWVH